MTHNSTAEFVNSPLELEHLVTYMPFIRHFSSKAMHSALIARTAHLDLSVLLKSAVLIDQDCSISASLVSEQLLLNE